MSLFRQRCGCPRFVRYSRMLVLGRENQLCVYLDKRDWWVGVYYDDDDRIVYVCPLPCLVFRWRRP